MLMRWTICSKIICSGIERYGGRGALKVESRGSNHLGATKHEYSNKLPKLFGTYIWDLSHGVCEPLARTFSSFPDCDWN